MALVPSSSSEEEESSSELDQTMEIEDESVESESENSSSEDEGNNVTFTDENSKWLKPVKRAQLLSDDSADDDSEGTEQIDSGGRSYLYQFAYIFIFPCIVSFVSPIAKCSSLYLTSDVI